MSKEHVFSALEHLASEAVAAGLMDENETLIWDRGVKAGGVPPALYVGGRGNVCTFMPRFTLKTTEREAILAMEAVTYALRTLCLNKVGGDQ